MRNPFDRPGLARFLEDAVGAGSAADRLFQEVWQGDAASVTGLTSCGMTSAMTRLPTGFSFIRVMERKARSSRERRGSLRVSTVRTSATR